MQLTTDKCFNFNCKSWGVGSSGVPYVIKHTPSTNWILYMIEFTKYARGFDFEMYTNGIGIKRIKIKK
jgi:hypothetical protein